MLLNNNYFEVAILSLIPVLYLDEHNRYNEAYS
jgi:hypothetical protein